MAIKLFRNGTGSSLRDSMEAVERMLEHSTTPKKDQP
jgi:hypothetical protein